MSAGRSLFRRSAVALAAAGLALATIVAAVHPAELVLSQGQDTEAAQASLNAQWPVSYASNQAYTAHQMKRRYTETNDNGSSLYRWQVQNFGSSSTATPYRGIDQILRQSSPIIDGASATNGVTQATGAYRIEQGMLRPGTTMEPIGTNRCMYVSYTPSPLGGAQCGALQGDTAAAKHRQPGFGYSLADHALRLESGAIWINGWGIETSVRCSPTGSVAISPSGNIDAVTGGLIVLGRAVEPDYSGTVREVWRGGTTSVNIQSSPQTVYSTAGVESGLKFKVLARTIQKQNYALSEVGLYVEAFTKATFLSPFVFRSKMYFTISKSECGTSTTGPSGIPLRSNAVPPINIFTNEDAATDAALNQFYSYQPNLSPTVLNQARLTRGIDAALDAAAAEVTVATTTSSPIEDATGVEVTTSAPPAGGGRHEDAASAATSSSRSTSAGDGKNGTSDVIPEAGSETTTAAPTTTATSEVPTVPDEPGRMPAGAEFCESLKVDGAYVDAFTADECDAEARISAMSALEVYIADGTQDPRWKGFTSDDPEAEGWRWAAVDQRTGHIVYVP